MMSRIYKATLIFYSSLKDDHREKALDMVKDEIQKLGGKIADTELTGRQTFARPMQKQDAGYYVRLLLEMEPADIGRLREKLRLNNDVFRVQIVSSDSSSGANSKGNEEKGKETSPDGQS